MPTFIRTGRNCTTMDIRIEPIKPEHAKDTWTFRNNERLWNFTKCDTPLPATYESEYRAYQQMQNDRSCQTFAIIYNESAVGTVKMKKIGHGTAELGYYLLRTDLWRKGLMKQALKLVIDHAFEQLKLDMLYLYANHKNTGSFALALKLGFYSIGTPFYSDIHRLELTRTDYLLKLKK